MACYEWSRHAKVSKQIETKHAAKNPDGTPGTIYEYEQVAPETVQTFSAEGISWDELAPYWTQSNLLLAQQTPVTVPDKDGRSWRGKVYDFDAGPNNKGVPLFNATIVMKYAVEV